MRLQQAHNMTPVANVAMHDRHLLPCHGRIAIHRHTRVRLIVVGAVWLNGHITYDCINFAGNQQPVQCQSFYCKEDIILTNQYLTEQ